VFFAIFFPIGSSVLIIGGCNRRCLYKYRGKKTNFVYRQVPRKNRLACPVKCKAYLTRVGGEQHKKIQILLEREERQIVSFLAVSVWLLLKIFSVCVMRCFSASDLALFNGLVLKVSSGL
jgi:hypothetical protein